MKCVFCQRPSDQSGTVEHIIPESLGNQDHVLPAGIVCDTCNQYFGTKIEKPLLETDYFRHARFRTRTPNKKGDTPSVPAFLLPTALELEYFTDREGNKGIAARREKDESSLINYVRTRRHGSMIIPQPALPDDKLVSRFLGKVAMEVLAHRFLEMSDGLECVATDPQLDPLRRYARFGEGPSFWPFHCRRIYLEDHRFVDKSGNAYEVLHEFALLYTEQKELYLVLAIYGTEYAINYAGPQLEGYETWLHDHSGRSYLEDEDW